MTPETSKVLELLIYHKENHEPLTLIELSNKSRISEYGRVERILKTLNSEGYISALKPGNGDTYMFYNLEEKAREHFENLDKEAHAKAEQQAQIKEQRQHDWKIAVFSTIGGSIAGLITSLIFWLITK